MAIKLSAPTRSNGEGVRQMGASPDIPRPLSDIWDLPPGSSPWGYIVKCAPKMESNHPLADKPLAVIRRRPPLRFLEALMH